MKDYYVFSQYGANLKVESIPNGLVKATITNAASIISEPLLLAKQLEELATYIRKYNEQSNKS